VERAKGQRSGQYAIPNKLYFRIGEVSDLVGVKPYVLRYWESEFPDIKPSKSKSGQRLYKRRDVELLLRIKELLYEERFTINGARKRLKDFSRTEAKEVPHATPMPVVHVETDESPRQLEAFPTADEEDEAAEVAHTGGKQVSVPARDQTKTFLKIKKDLEELLTMVRA
jgi:DNA-binding transcriptional MerR regulator